MPHHAEPQQQQKRRLQQHNANASSTVAPAVAMRTIAAIDNPWLLELAPSGWKLLGRVVSAADKDTESTCRPSLCIACCTPQQTSQDISPTDKAGSVLLILLLLLLQAVCMYVTPECTYGATSFCITNV